MNIFVLHQDPTIAAQMACDKHVVKMVLETAQLLCSVVENAPYKRTHYNHPCAIWTRKSMSNVNWLVIHGLALCDEYTHRYGKVHKSQQVIEWCRDNIRIADHGLTPFALAMPDVYHSDDVVDSYRRYYIYDKMKIAAWNKTRQAPHWWLESLLNISA